MMLKPGGLSFWGWPMHFDKPPLSLADQVALWRSRGLQVADVPRAVRYLDNIGYYRLSAYCLPFEVLPAAGERRQHQFIPGTTFEQVLQLYIFDRKLRLLVIEAIERLEVAVRTRWAHAMSLRHGAHAHMDSACFKDPRWHAQNLASLARDMEHSTETFVVHYRATYTSPDLPPIWAVVETMSLGALSHWVKNTRDNVAKQTVANSLGLPTVEVMERVLHVLTPIRNACAHHSRLWNRRLPMKLPHIKRQASNLVPPESPHHQANYLYNPLALLAVMLNTMNPGTTWAARLVRLLDTELPADRLSAMGFPQDWRTRPVWQEGNKP